MAERKHYVLRSIGHFDDESRGKASSDNFDLVARGPSLPVEALLPPYVPPLCLARALRMGRTLRGLASALFADILPLPVREAKAIV